jgi:2-polyprenyl-6-methoxyphenol hydroxylase-like FAD-dependent oxidoreductase
MGQHARTVSPARQPRIAVVGGSLTGPASALMLLHAGFERIAVYEATPAAAPLGGGLISLEHSALDILDRLGICQDEFVPYPGEHISRTTAHHDRPATRARRPYPGRHSTWTLLHEALIRRLPSAILHRGHRVAGISEHHGEAVLTFHHGHSATADLIVFADGRASTGRRLLEPERRLHYAGYVAHRGTAAAGARQPNRPGQERPEQPERPQHPKGLEQPAEFERYEPCPGMQFNMAPVPAGIDWTFYLNASVEQYTRHFGAPPQQRVFALPRHVSAAARHDVDCHATRHLTRRQADVVCASAVRMAVPVMDIDVPTTMVFAVGRAHAVLIGDALAPVRPHTARGANNGLEQAAGLVAALTQHRKYGADLDGALTGWQRRHLSAAVAAVRLGPVIGGRLGLGTR